MKKLLSILLAILMLSFMLFACDKDNDIMNTDATSSIEEPSKEEDQKLIVGFTITSEQLEKAFLTEEELQEKILSKKFCKIYDFIVISNQVEQKNIVMHIENDKVSRIEAYDMVITSPEATTICEGMSIYEVIEVAGYPKRFDYGEFTYDRSPKGYVYVFFCEDGTGTVELVQID